MHNGVLIYILLSMLHILHSFFFKKHFYNNGNLFFFFKYDSCHVAVHVMY